MKDVNIIPLIQEDEKTFLLRVHTVRNYAQHRASIPDSLTTQEYMKWLCKFVERFAKDNFDFDMNLALPNSLKFVWTKLTQDAQKFNGMPLKEPLEKNYKSVKQWLIVANAKSHRGYISEDQKTHLVHHLKKYCKFIGMNPDELVEYAENGRVSPNDYLASYEKTFNNPNTQHNMIKNFYAAHKINITLPYHPYKPRSTIKEISTEQIRAICAFAPLKLESMDSCDQLHWLKACETSINKNRGFPYIQLDQRKENLSSEN